MQGRLKSLSARGDVTEYNLIISFVFCEDEFPKLKSARISVTEYKLNYAVGYFWRTDEHTGMSSIGLV